MKIFRKIAKNFVEGQFFKVIFTLIADFFRGLRAFVDYGLAAIARLILSGTSKIQNNKVVFMTFNNNYMCNQKYICEELLKQELPLDIVWVCTKAQIATGQYPKNVRLVIRDSYEFFKEVATAKVWVDNALNFTWNPIPKKKGQFYLQTWHGSMGLKRIGKQDVKNARWSMSAAMAGKATTVCISNSTFETEVFRTTHWPKTEILELGHARNDVFFLSKQEQAKIRSRVCEFYDIPESYYIALYAPTFRNDDAADTYDLDHMKFVRALEAKFGGRWVLLNRYHFKTKNARKNSVETERIISATAYPDIQELIVAADVGITDYSSWICDLVLTQKPGFIYAPDLKAYDSERGFYYPLEETPFPIAETNEELAERIRNFDPATYEQKRQEFLKARGCKEDGHATEKIVEIIKGQCGLTQ
jgi:CDP-glycerol glycerophosphotransferase